MSGLNYTKRISKGRPQSLTTFIDVGRRSKRNEKNQSTKIRHVLFNSNSTDGPSVKFYTFSAPAPGVEISLTLTTADGSRSSVDFGDGTKLNTVVNNSTVSHTY